MNPLNRIYVGGRTADQPARRSRRINPTMPGQKRVRPWHWYDTHSIAASTATGTEISLFTTPIGQSSKTKLQTNMVLPGSLPPGWDFSCYALRIGYMPDIAFVDAAALHKNFYVRVEFNQTTWLETFLECVPYGAGITGQRENTTASTLTSFSNNGVPDPRSILTFPEGLHIAAGEQFSVKLLAPAGFTTAASPATGITIRAVLEGVDNSIIS